MRISFVVAASLAISVVPSLALADIGPPPKCPDGFHDEYHYGHHCVADGPAVSTTTTPSTTTVPSESTTTAPSTTATTGTTAPTTSPAEKRSGCACAIEGDSSASEGAAIGGSCVALALVIARRRRR